MSKELEALKEIEQYNFGGVKDFSKHIAIVETALKNNQKTIDKLSNEIKHLKATDRRNKKKLKDYEELKKGITWRKAEYKKELDFGVDCDGIPLSETNKTIVSNLYNIMCALESYYKKEVLK